MGQARGPNSQISALADPHAPVSEQPPPRLQLRGVGLDCIDAQASIVALVWWALHSSNRPVLAEVAEKSRVFQALAKAKPRAQPKPAAKPKAKAKAAAPTPRQVAEGGA